MRTTVDIEQDLLERLRNDAHEQGVSFKEQLNRVVRRGIEAPPPDRGPFCQPTFAMGEVRRPLDRALRVADALEDEEIVRKLGLRK